MMASRLLLVAGSLALALGLASGCSDWPPGERTDANSPGASDGYCKGTPRPCSGLTAAQCEAIPGCDDMGTCAGSGVACGAERTAAFCESNSDCYWSPACSGTPVGCIAGNKTSCESMPGCTWVVANGGGTGGAGSGGAGSGGAGGGWPAPNCPSLEKACATAATCDCNMQCLVLCTGCPAICAKACTTDADCRNTGGNNKITPYCVRFTATQYACSPDPD